MNLTVTQQEAIAARGNVLVVAGAGTGKTRTLVERCLACLLQEKPRASLEEILMVTFTEAAAAEMRQRIRARLEEELARPSVSTQGPRQLILFESGQAAMTAVAAQKTHWQEQLALFETAHIGTLHSFCLKLVREHFYQLELDPQFSVLAEEEARLLAEETLDDLLQKHYGGRGPAAEAVQQLIQVQGRGRDKPVRALVLRLHHYAQTLPDPAGWMAGQLNEFASAEPALWESWLLEGVIGWREQWLPRLKAATGNAIARECAAVLNQLAPQPSRVEAAAALDLIAASADGCPHRKKTQWLEPLEDFFKAGHFLGSLAGKNTASPATPSDIQPATPPGSGPQPGTEQAPQPIPDPDRPIDPLKEDWSWVRSQMRTLLELARQFGADFTEAKRELGVVDFHDLEQCALRLLWDPAAQQPTKIALQWRQKLRFVFVDEYQDINAAQDKIIEALSRDGPKANRFLVGDVKQSIYRFRLADPHIFQGYIRAWSHGEKTGTQTERGIQEVETPIEQHAPREIEKLSFNPHSPHPAPHSSGTVIPLVENFRSREGILNFINSLFETVMSPEVGGVIYDEQARLRFGAPKQRQALQVAPGSGPEVELHLRLKGNRPEQGEDEQSAEALAEVRDLEDADKEARLVALRLLELKAGQQPVWDEAAGRFRPAQWRDMALLLRSPARKSERYAKEFSRLNIPLQVARGGFYQSLEISDLLSLLQILDNPLQDLPVLSVLHSPLVGLTLNELAGIRLTVKKARFWTALVRWVEIQSQSTKIQKPAGASEPVTGEPTQSASGTQNQKLSSTDTHPTPGPDAGTLRKLSTFLEQFARWRRLARQASLSRCLEAVLSETHYDDWLLTQPRGPQRHANVQRLLTLAQQFDQFQRQGLFRFLHFIEAQQLAESEPEVAAVNQENAVRLLSIHQSKGLEFPIVFLADLGKQFNLSDLRAEIILDEYYGLCPQIKPPHTGKRYPSLPYWLARQRQTRELLGEELRLLYVGMTRARDLLLLSGSVSAEKLHRLWKQRAETTPAALLAARSFADWIGLWFAQNCAAASLEAAHGKNAWLRWSIHEDSKLLERPADLDISAEPDAPGNTADAAVWQQLQQRLSSQYAFASATRQPAKTSVSLLRRRAAVADEEFSEAQFSVRGPKSKFESSSRPVRPGLSQAAAAEIGTAHHTFLQLVSLEQTGSVEVLAQEGKRLACTGALTPEQVALLDLDGLAAFWNSDLGRKVRSQARFVQRELAFTARFAPNDLAQLVGEPQDPGLAQEFIVVQGIADLAVLLPQEIWLIDFKTDRVGAEELSGRAGFYQPQLKIYARALAQIYQRPVTEAWLYFLECRKAVAVAPAWLEA